MIRGGEHETVEGDWQPGRVVVLEFPDMTALKGSSVADMILVEGV